jgi:hypothetical protein
VGHVKRIQSTGLRCDGNEKEVIRKEHLFHLSTDIVKGVRHL